MYCTRCGHPNKDEARFCANCGAVLQEETTLGLNPVEIEAEGLEDFPFPEDELNKLYQNAPRFSTLATGPV